MRRIIPAARQGIQPPPLAAPLYNAAMREEAVQIFTGPAGWSYPDWKGVFYPAETPRAAHPLERIAALFDLVEVNATFYRPASARHAAAWLRAVAANPRFLFTVKLWERCTHQRDAWPGAEELRRWREGAAPLAEAGKLGAVLAQFPWSFRRTPENRAWLARIADAFGDWPLAVELRHASWECPEFLGGLRERGIACCNIDQPLFKESIAPASHITAPFAYIRLHGRNRAAWFREDATRDQRYDYLYTGDELKSWIDRVEQMKRGVNRFFIVANNHYRAQAIINALEIQAALGKTPPFAAVPPALFKAYPRLQALYPDAAPAAGQLELD